MLTERSAEEIEAARKAQLAANERFAIRRPSSGITMTDDLRARLAEIKASMALPAEDADA